MSRKQLPWILCSLLVICMGMNALGAAQATRTLAGEFYIPGVQISVTLKITGDAGAITVIEQPPVGWTISKVIASGVIADGKITWNLSDFSGAKTLTYTLTPPADAAQDGVFTGKVGDVEISGMAILYAPKPTPGKQAPMKTGLTYPYWLYLPDDYNRSNQLWPLIVFLHGAGERGDTLTAVKTHGPPKLLDLAASRTKFPELFQCIVVSPQCPNNKWWLNPPLHEVFNEILAKYAVNLNRIYLTGLSMGGFGTWSYASEYPETIAAAIPICGAGDAMKWSSITSYTRDTIPAANLNNLVKIPIWAFHGSKDTTVPQTLDYKTVSDLMALGGNVKYTVYPTADHDSWTVTYNNPEVYKWLLQQDKSAKAPVEFGTSNR